MASLLALLALVTLVIKSILEWRFGDELVGRTQIRSDNERACALSHGTRLC